MNCLSEMRHALARTIAPYWQSQAKKLWRHYIALMHDALCDKTDGQATDKGVDTCGMTVALATKSNRAKASNA